jgi:hypothetical protein
MNRNGMPILKFHGPALIGGVLAYFRGTRYVDDVVALCFVPYVGHLSGHMIDSQAQRFEDVGAALLIVVSGPLSLRQLWIGQRDKPVTPILADPCGRLHRSFAVAVQEPAQQCHTFVIDGTGIVRLRLSHDFVEHDLTILQEVIGSSQGRVTHGLMSQSDAVDLSTVCPPA